ncbi:MAG: radical SAM protein [Gemmatimonadota bacterium]|nr:radical SAM protein [Gemmatimonadota bacterium]
MNPDKPEKIPGREAGAENKLTGAGSGPEGNELRLLFWETTAGCNLACRHCRRLETGDRSGGQDRGLAPGDMGTADCLRLLDEVASFASPIIVLSGGEPLMRPDIYRIAGYAHERGLAVALATNGTLIDREAAEKITASGVRRVAISFDGATAGVHESFRGLTGSFEQAVKGFRELKNLGMSMQVNCTVARHNVHELENIYSLARDLGADALHFFLLVPVGCGVELSKQEQLEPARYEEVLNWIYDKSLENCDLQLKATCAPHYFRILYQRGWPEAVNKKGREHGRGDKMHAMTRGCLAGTAVCFVSHRGEVFPCGYLPVSAGNVLETPLEKIWNEAHIFKLLRDTGNLTGKCGLCEYRNICMGCRARAYGESGDFLAEEPYCTYVPKRMREG